MEVDQEHAYAFNENPMEMDPLAFVDTTIKEEVKDDPEPLLENNIQHETHSDVHHEIKIEDLDESYYHTASNSDFPSIDDIGSAQLDEITNSVVSSSIVKGLQNEYRDVKIKYANSIQVLRKQSDALAQTHVEMQLEIENLKTEKGELWRDLCALRTKEYLYVKQIADIKAKNEKKMKMLKNKYARMLQTKNGQLEENVWKTATVLGHKVERLAASNKNCMATVEVLKDKLKLQEQYKSAIEIKKVSLQQKLIRMNNDITLLHDKLLKEKKAAEHYATNCQKMQIEYKKMSAETAALKTALSEKDSVLIAFRDQIHNLKEQLENKQQSVKAQAAAAKKGLEKVAVLDRNMMMKDTLLEQLRGQKHKIIKKNKALVGECIALTEKLQAANERINELENEVQQVKHKTCEYCGL